MIRFAADENFNLNVVRGVRRRNVDVDIVTVQEAGLTGATDEDVLSWAAREGRVVLSHDTNTMISTAAARIGAGRTMCGLILADQNFPIGQCVDEIIDIHTYEDPEMWDYRIDHLPLK